MSKAPNTFYKSLSLLFCCLCAHFAVAAQYILKEITDLGKLQARHIQYYADSREWILSDGYAVFKAKDDFSGTSLLFNSYPRFQYAIERLPNKNFYCRHFDTKLPPYGYDIRTRLFDSSALYIVKDSLQQVNNILPFTYLNARRPADGKQVISWATNNCFSWGKDSVVLCNNGTIGIVRNISDKDSLITIGTNNRITSLCTDRDAQYTVAGTRDSGWYFIPLKAPEQYVHVKENTGKEVTGFYFDEVRSQIWVSMGNYAGFSSLVVYDYSSGRPLRLRELSSETLGLVNAQEPIFAFDFKGEKLYIKSGLSSLNIFDLGARQVTYDFWSLLHMKVSAIHQLYFNESDEHLYISASRQDTMFNAQSALYRIEADASGFVKVISPANTAAANELYAPGIHAVVNKIPGTSAGENCILAENDLSLIPLSGSTYALYNIRNGNMIHAFRSYNIDLNIGSRFSEANKAALSPGGKYIFEWMIKAGVASGIADTLQMALIQIANGNVVKDKIVLPAANSTSISKLSWNEDDMPVFTRQMNGDYPTKMISAFYLDSLLQPHTIAEKTLHYKDTVVYNTWHVSGTSSLLTETANLYGKKTYRYTYMGADGEKLLYSTAEAAQVMLNAKGFALRFGQEEKTMLMWFDQAGNALHTSAYNSAEYRFQHLLQSSPVVYLIQQQKDVAARLDLLTGTISPLYSKSFSAYSCAVSPAEDMLLSVADKQITAWKIDGDTLYQLYRLKTENDVIRYSFITDKYLISDSRTWNFGNGFMESHGTASVTVLGDTQVLQTAYPQDVLDNLGWDENFTKRYAIKPHLKLFSKNLSGSPDLNAWSLRQKNILLLSKNIAGNSIQNIYELPLAKDDGQIELYPSAAQQNVLVIKKQFKLFDNDIMTSPTDSIALLDLENGKTTMLQGKVAGFKQMRDHYLFYLLNQKTGMMQLYKTSKQGLAKINTKVRLSIDSFRHVNIVDEQNIFYKTINGIVFFNLNSGDEKPVNFYYLSGDFNLSSSMFYDDAAQAVFIAYEDGGIVSISKDGVFTCIKTLPSAEKICGANKKYLLVLDKTGNYYFINKRTLQADLGLYTWQSDGYANRKYIWLNKENFYMASAGVESQIHFANESNIIPLKQGDLYFNRPDKVLEYLDAPKAEVDFYKELHQIRVNKYKGKTGDGQIETGIQLRVSSVIRTRKADITVSATAASNIRSLYIMVNGCPVYVDTTLSGKQLSRTIPVMLNAGNNSIYTWVQDDKGNRSHFDEQKITGEFADSGRWYFIGIGVSGYKDSTKNLKYADKDIRDLTKFLSGKYPGIVIDTLLNEAVTAANIRRIAQKLQSTQPDDKILVSLSGHGLLDEEKKFWYATHDVDFEQPKQSGFAMGDIIAMLEYVPARYRLITLDACHSGDVAASENVAATSSATQAQVIDSTTMKGLKLLGAKDGYSSGELLKSMQRVFTDQLSNTGINLIAASSGTEFALEGKNWSNGVFTYALIEGWSHAAMQNTTWNRKVHYRNLKQYVQKTVSSITGGRQTPNTVMENGEIDWWLVPEE